MHRSTFNHIVAACSTEDRHSTRYSLQIVMPQVRNSIKWIIAVLERCSFVFLAKLGPRPETRTFFAFRCTARKPRGQVQQPRTVNNYLIAQPRKNKSAALLHLHSSRWPYSPSLFPTYTLHRPCTINMAKFPDVQLRQSLSKSYGTRASIAKTLRALFQRQGLRVLELNEI